jgi:uncharacterized protein (UPF0332 family)
VTPEAAAFLDKARQFLAKADDMLSDDWADEAGRAAYLAGMHAAQAYIFESTGKIVRRHRGVQAEFSRLAKDEPRFDTELRAFLGRAYNLKASADYGTGPGSLVSRSKLRPPWRQAFALSTPSRTCSRNDVRVEPPVGRKSEAYSAESPRRSR